MMVWHNTIISEVKHLHEELCPMFNLTVEIEKAVYEMKVPFVWTSDFVAEKYTPLEGRKISDQCYSDGVTKITS